MAETALYLFETTNQAMWAEEVARDQGIPSELVSAPAEAEAKCGLALECLLDQTGRLEAAFTEAGVPFERSRG